RERGEAGILAAIQAEHQSLTLAVLGHKPDTRSERGIAGPGRKRGTFDGYAPRNCGIQTEKGLNRFAAASSDDAGNPDNFAGADGKVNVRKFPWRAKLLGT